MSDQYSFLYLIHTNHYIVYNGEFVKILGYGKTASPKKRSKQYSDHSGTEQEFVKLWFGSAHLISSLESIIKQRVASKSHKIYGQYVEWISPKHNMTVEELTNLVNRTIAEEEIEVYPISEDYLPFDNLDEHNKLTLDEINNDPKRFLENKG